MTHKELDDLFRANSDRGDFSPHQEEWEAMTALLDADDRKIRNQKILSGLWLVVFGTLIIAGIWGVVYYTHNGEDLQLPQPSDKYAQQFDESNNADLEVVTKSNIERPLAIKANDLDKRKSFSSALDRLESGLDLVVQSEKKSAASFSSEAFAKTRNATRVSGQFEKENQVASPKFTVDFDEDVEGSKPTAKSFESEFRHHSKDVQSKRLKLFSADGTFAVATDKSPLRHTIEKETKALYQIEKLGNTKLEGLRLSDTHLQDLPNVLPPNPSVGMQARKVSLGLIASTERITVDFNGDGQYGLSLGGGARMQMTDKIGFGVSLTYSSKKYNAKESSYTSLTDNHWVGELPAHQTAGEVRALEIPVYADYLLLGTKQNSLYGFTGISGTYLLRERLHHFYPRSIPGQTHQWENTTQGRLGLSVQLGIGYRIVSKRLPAIRIGPYVQVPIKGVGHGSVQLYTGGINLSVGI